MSQTNTAERKTLSVRPATSRKLLARKAAEKVSAADADNSEALEACFPAEVAPAADGAGTDDAASLQHDAAPAVEYIQSAGDAPAPAFTPAVPADCEAPSAVAPPPAEATVPAQPVSAPEPESAPSGTAAAAPAAQPATAQAWSAEDESALNAMLARRKAAGYQRRGRDVGGQLIRLGDVKPNPNTVVAVIVDLVAAAGGTVGRAELVAMMGEATFPNAKAQPGDKGWCQGYIQGCVRSAHLALADVSAQSADGAGNPGVSTHAGNGNALTVAA